MILFNATLKAYYALTSIFIFYAILFGLFGCNTDTTESEESAAPQTEYYHIIFHRNYGEDDVIVDIPVPINETKFTIPDCTDDRINFENPPMKSIDYWNTKPNGLDGRQYKIGDKYKPINIIAGQSVNLYAIWKNFNYTIVFNANGGKGLMSPQTMIYDVSAALSANTYTKSGYGFDRWTTNPNGSGTSYSDKQPVTNLTDVNGAEITLYAQWKFANMVINGVEYKKTLMTEVLNKTTQIKCDQSDGAFPSARESVTIKPYAIGKYEVTQELYKAVMGNNPSYFTESKAALGTDETNALLRPVGNVGWYDAITFCNKLSLLMEKTPCYAVSGISDWSGTVTIPSESNADWNNATCDWNADGYRLPTECEWECAARGGMYSTTTPWTYTYSGSDTLNDVAWYSGNGEAHTWEVGLKTSNILGLYDMSGNVWEWCWDYYSGSDEQNDDVAIDKDTPVTGPTSVSNPHLRRNRGCASHTGYNQKWYKVFTRSKYRTYDHANFQGFRIACSLEN
ncbi:MAG: SUMF1/EgtB/PvdO family nonheme iron enzyme [Spirochaetales bacterium]|nr:SUMF1/EgtB/PvdO family nonheme iron enzyme [Spirochaetales bacterium]